MSKKIIKALCAIRPTIIGNPAYLVLDNGGRVRTSDVESIVADKEQTQIETQNSVYVYKNKPWFPFEEIRGDLAERCVYVLARDKRGYWSYVYIQPSHLGKCLQMDQCVIETHNALYLGELSNGEFVLHPLIGQQAAMAARQYAENERDFLVRNS